MGVLNTIEILKAKRVLVEDDMVYEALQQVQITGLQGRWHTLQRKTISNMNTGHNEDGIKEIIRKFKTTTIKLYILY